MRRLKMAQALRLSLSRLRGSVGLRLLVAVLLFSSAVTLTLTAIQLSLEYQRGAERIERQLAEIGNSYLDSLAEGLWRLDRDYLQIQVQGILRLPDIRAVEVREVSRATADGAFFAVTAGERGKRALLAREFPILYSVRGSVQRIGTLYVEATLTGLYREVMTTALVILVSQGLKTFLVSLFILYMVQRLITRHLAALADFVYGFDLRHPPPPLCLARPPPGSPDELEQVVTAFNAMCAGLQQAYDDLRVREARIRQLVEANIIGVVFVDAGGRVIEANDAFLQMLGYQRADLLAGRINWREMTPPESLAASERALDEIRRSGRCTPFEKEYLSRDGSRVPALVGGVRLAEAPEQIVSFVLDLTQHKQAEAERLARLAAEAANRAKSTFLANMSHELRTPLNAILGYAAILQREAGLSPRQAGGLETIRQSGEHLLTLINDLLDLAKIESGKFELAPEALDLPAFLSVVADIIRVRADEKDLLFALAAAPDLPATVLADGRRLRQVLLNLLGNAVKFTDRGEVSLRVQVLQRDGENVRLRFAVTDSGIGIAPEALAIIFQPFEQVGDAQHREAGTGLGLAISRRLVQLMGSEIEVLSQPGSGSRLSFELGLPLVAAGAAAEPARRAIAAYRGARRRVLIVDDVAANRVLLADLLGSLGFLVVEAADGRQALAEAQAAVPDLVLMDLVMPVMGGQEAIRRLRATPGLEAVAIIALSASGEPEDQARARGWGADLFLAKPIDLDRLLAAIGALLKLEWVDAEVPPAAAGGTSAAVLKIPPADELAILHRLALRGDMRGIRQWAADLQAVDDRYRPFTERLVRLAGGYQSKAILALVEAQLGEEKAD